MIITKTIFFVLNKWKVLDRLHAKEENCKNLQIEIEDQHQKVGVIRHQMGLLYEEFHKEKEGWKINRSEYENTIRYEPKQFLDNLRWRKMVQ